MIETIEKYLPQANIVESRHDKVRIVVREFWFEIKVDNKEFWLNIEVKAKNSPQYFTISRESFKSLEDVCVEIERFLLKQQMAIAKTFAPIVQFPPKPSQ